MKEKEVWVYNKKSKTYIKLNKWTSFKQKIKKLITRYKIADTWKYKLVPYEDSKYYFKMSPKEYEDAKRIYKEKGTISYEFYPCGGVGWGLRLHAKCGEVIDVTDYNSW